MNQLTNAIKSEFMEELCARIKTEGLCDKYSHGADNFQCSKNNNNNYFGTCSGIWGSNNKLWIFTRKTGKTKIFDINNEQVFEQAINWIKKHE